MNTLEIIQKFTLNFDDNVFIYLFKIWLTIKQNTLINVFILILTAERTQLHNNLKN